MCEISLNKVYKSYGKDSTLVQALKNINLTISSGDLVAIIGISGSGKSTLLNIIGGIDKVSSGEILFNNEKIHDLNDLERAKFRNENIGFIFQNFALFSDYNVIENIELPAIYSALLKNKKYDKNYIKTKITELLESLSITELKNKKINELSGGQQQRVAIARALINEPNIILADEPTGSLDARSSMEIMDIFKRLNDMGKTIIIVTHDEKIAYSCKKIIKVEDGEIIS